MSWSLGNTPAADWSLNIFSLLFPTLVLVDICKPPFNTFQLSYNYTLQLLAVLGYVIYGGIVQDLSTLVCYLIYTILVLAALLFKYIREKSVPFLEQQILLTYTSKRELEHEFHIRVIDKYHVELIPKVKERRIIEHERFQCRRKHKCRWWHIFVGQETSIRNQREYIHTHCNRYIISTKDQWTIECEHGGHDVKHLKTGKERKRNTNNKHKNKPMDEEQGGCHEYCGKDSFDEYDSYSSDCEKDPVQSSTQSHSSNHAHSYIYPRSSSSVDSRV